LVDILKEHIALQEAKRLNIPVFALVDTNTNPNLVDFPIPANDDATKSISIILDAICDSIRTGLEDRKNSKEKADKAEAENATAAATTTEETNEQ
jgi:small subunit ribosomal protein S2